MKILFSFLFLALSLFSRENPFEATETFEQKKKEYLKQIELEKEAQAKAEEAIAKEKELQELAAKLEKEKDEKERLEKLALEEEEKRKALEQKQEAEKLAEQKALEEEIEKNALKYNPLEFVSFKVYEDHMTINVEQLYKLLNVDVLKPSNKFLFDFKGHTDFYTKRKVLDNHPLFKSIAIGNHPQKGYFRIVIETNGDIKDFKEDIDVKNGIITINKL